MGSSRGASRRSSPHSRRNSPHSRTSSPVRHTRVFRRNPSPGRSVGGRSTISRTPSPPRHQHRPPPLVEFGRGGGRAGSQTLGRQGGGGRNDQGGRRDFELGGRRDFEQGGRRDYEQGGRREVEQGGGGRRDWRDPRDLEGWSRRDQYDRGNNR